MSSKNCVIIILGILLLSSLALAEEYKIGISTLPEGRVFQGGETIKIRATLYDSQNILLNDNISIIFKDIKENIIAETTISSKDAFKDLEINEDALSGEGKILLTYKETTSEETFFIGEREMAKFEIKEGNLIVTNIGNTKYNKKIYITIGETTGTKTPDLNIGESASYRLIAPEGIYNNDILRTLKCAVSEER